MFSARNILTFRSLALQSRNFWESVARAPEDPILGLTAAFNKDPNPKKIILGAGAYRDDKGKPFVLNCVKEAEKRIQNMDHEYLPIGGDPTFCGLAAELLLGEKSQIITTKRNVTMQSLSGTGALRIAASFLQRFYPKKTYFPTPTWPNHFNIFRDAGLETGEYPYYNASQSRIEIEKLLSALDQLESGSVVALHACAHNPTGMDPTQDQWKEIHKVIKNKHHFVLFDVAYQGFASGDPVRDAFAVNYFLENGNDNMVICQSFAKNFGLYGERIGAVTFVAKDEEQANVLASQLRRLIRPMYSNPPLTGARLVTAILKDAGLKAEWAREVKQMADRINSMRTLLEDKLKAAGSTRNWSHISKQIGMFSYTGITSAQVDRLRTEYSLYMTQDGRISVAGLNNGNVEEVAKRIHEVTK